MKRSAAAQLITEVRRCSGSHIYLEHDGKINLRAPSALVDAIRKRRDQVERELRREQREFLSIITPDDDSIDGLAASPVLVDRLFGLASLRAADKEIEALCRDGVMNQ